MHVLMNPAPTSETFWLVDPTDQFAIVAIGALAPYTPALSVRRVPAPLPNPYRYPLPEWVLDDWLRATWSTLPPQAGERTTIVVTGRVPPPDLVTGSLRTVRLLFDPTLTVGDGRVIDQWRGVVPDDRLDPTPAPMPTDATILVDTPDALILLLSDALRIGPKRAHRAITAASRQWPKFQDRKGDVDQLDLELYIASSGSASMSDTVK